MHRLSTDDLRFLAKVILNQIDFDYKKYDLDENYLKDVRDGLLNMADGVDHQGEVEIQSNYAEKTNPDGCPCKSQ